MEMIMRKQDAINILHDNMDCLRELGVKSLAIFGSVARDEAQPGSDIDILVDFGQAPTFDQYMNLKFYLEDRLGIPVDLATPKALKKRIIPYVEAEAIRVA